MKSGLLSRHRRLVAVLKAITVRFRPHVVYQHSFVYPHNVYAYLLAKRQRASVRHVMFQAALTAFNLDVLAVTLAAGEARRLVQRYKILSFLPTAAIFRTYHMLWCLVNYTIIPIFLLGRSLPRPYDLVRGRMREGVTFTPDICLVYSQMDAANLAKEFGSSFGFRIIRNPVAECGDAVNLQGYGMLSRKNSIAILPSQDWANEEIFQGPRHATRLLAAMPTSGSRQSRGFARDFPITRLRGRPTQSTVLTP